MKYLYYILFFVVPFVVLPVSSELFEFNKMIFIYGVTSLIGSVWLLRCMREKKFIIKRTPFDIPLGIFFVSQVISTLFSIDQHTSLFGYYGRFNGGLISTFTYIFLYYAFVSNIEKDKNKIIRMIFGISIISSIMVVLWGLPGKFNHDLSCLLFTNKFDNTCWTAQFRPAERMFSTLGQPNWLGAYLAITFFISLAVLFTTQTKKITVLGLMGMIFSYVGILLSRSRSSLVSIIPGVIFIALFFLILVIRKSKWISQIKMKLIFITLGILVILTLVAQTGISQVDTIFNLSFLKKTAQAPTTQLPPTSPQGAPAEPSLQVIGPITESLDIRKIVWQGAWELGKQYPLFGTGVETFGYAYYSVRPQSHNLTSEWDYLYNKAHNEYLNLLATTGWFGVYSFALLVIWVGYTFFKKIIQHRTDSSTVLTYLTFLGIFVSICITNFFGFSITIINVYWYIMLGFLILYNEPNSITPPTKNKTSILQIGFVFIIFLWLMNSIGAYWIADYKYAQADIALKNNNVETSVALLQEALSLRNEHVYEDKLSYVLAQYAYMLATQRDKDKAAQATDMAEKLNDKSLKASSQNVLYWKTRVKNQFIFYQMSLDKKYLHTGLSALEEARKLAPTDPKVPYFSATYNSLLYDDEKVKQQKKFYETKSLEAIDKTIALKPDYGDAYYLKFQLLKKYGNKAEAKKLLEWYIPRYAPGNQEMIKELNQL